MAKIGFKGLSAQLAAKGASDPDALAAYIGKKKYGVGKFAHLANHAKSRKATMTSPARTAGRGPRAELQRAYPLEDIKVLGRAEGYPDGRVVEAYAAVFDQEAEIHDGEGHYLEVIDRTAFNRAIDHAKPERNGGRWRTAVFYNHGMTIHGTPAERFSIPIGVPVDIAAERRGVLTRTRYNETPLGEEILESVRTGAIVAQSFTGAIMRSDPGLMRGEKHRKARGALTTVRRLELGLREYGPTPFPAYSGAEILGVRMALPGQLDYYDEDEIDDGGLLDEAGRALIDVATPPDGGPGTGGPPGVIGHPTRHHQNALFRMRLEDKLRAAGIVLPGQ